MEPLVCRPGSEERYCQEHSGAVARRLRQSNRDGETTQAQALQLPRLELAGGCV